MRVQLIYPLALTECTEPRGYTHHTASSAQRNPEIGIDFNHTTNADEVSTHAKINISAKAKHARQFLGSLGGGISDFLKSIKTAKKQQAMGVKTHTPDGTVSLNESRAEAKPGHLLARNSIEPTMVA